MAATNPFRLISAAPRSHLFTRVSTTFAARSCRRTLSTTQVIYQDSQSSLFNGGPAPPRLPKEEQEIFEALQRQSTGAFSTPRSPPQINQSPDSTPTERASAASETASRVEKLSGEDTQAGGSSKFKETFEQVIEARGKGEELHPNIRRGARPEFEGDINPKTGEVGGPKNEPLRWGAAGEWSYNGRTTDF